MVEINGKTGFLESSCASSTLETKSKVALIIKNEVLYLRSNIFKELIPFFIILKAIGVETDKEIVQLIDPFLY